VGKLGYLLSRFVLAAAVFAGGSFVQATSVLAPDFETMVRRADLIFTGRVTGQHAEWRNVAGQRSIVTLVTFDVLGVHKGRAGRTVSLQFLGGKIGPASLDVEAMPKFHAGERAVLFVEQNGVNASPLIGFFHGKFNVLTDGTMTHYDQTPLGDVREIGKSRAQRGTAARAMSQTEFAGKIQAAAQKAN
jgi:hypothetical protein